MVGEKLTAIIMCPPQMWNEEQRNIYLQLADWVEQNGGEWRVGIDCHSIVFSLADKEKKKTIFKKSFGPSKRRWNALGTTSGVLCELCGKEWPESESGESYTIGLFLGKQYVEECCGKLIDNLYDIFGDLFTLAFLEDFAENPAEQRFSFFCRILPNSIKKARRKLEKLAQETAKVQEQISGIDKVSLV